RIDPRLSTDRGSIFEGRRSILEGRRSMVEISCRIRQNLCVGVLVPRRFDLWLVRGQVTSLSGHIRGKPAVFSTERFLANDRRCGCAATARSSAPARPSRPPRPDTIPGAIGARRLGHRGMMALPKQEEVTRGDLYYAGQLHAAGHAIHQGFT